ncbi:MAG: phosphatase PAP2 family protein [bacterium]|nr:phosphatase PAP2 family protein [bacterium]
MLDAFMIFSAKYLYLLIILITFLYFVKLKISKKKILIFSGIVLSAIFVVSQIASKLYYNPRPFVVKHFTPLIYHAANNGFPSDHSLISFAFASIAFVLNRKLGLILFALAFLVGLSRIYVGVHFPIDVLGSFLISVIVAGICVKIFPWMK